jgi:putative metal-binding protein
MIVWGGEGGPSLNSGARYTPVADKWTVISNTGTPWPRASHTSIWTGSLLVIWGGRDDGTRLDSGGRYDPATDEWSPTSRANIPPPGFGHTAVWTGNEMLLWSGSVLHAGRYSPLTNTWSTVSQVGAPVNAGSPVWTGHVMVVHGPNGGGRYDPIADAWLPMSSIGAPPASPAAWCGNVVVFWGGGVGARYNPVADMWSPVANGGAPTSGSLVVCMGRIALVWGPNGGSRYDSDADLWTSASSIGAPGGVSQENSVWTGSQVLSWTGAGYDDVPVVGGRYDPVSDTWGPIADYGNYYPLRHFRVVWTGAEMIVWGGYTANLSPHNFGRRYDPVTDAWSSMSTIGAPPGRSRHSQVWAGSAMIVWGGDGAGLQNQLDDGGMYFLGATFDNDGDGYSECDGDCNDSNSVVYPAAPQACDGINNDCSDSAWPALPTNETDSDGDGFSECQGDCSDDNITVFPGANQLCDGINNDCDDLDWPGLSGTNESDDDGDGYTECSNDCNDADSAIHPNAVRLCDGIDNDCSHGDCDGDQSDCDEDNDGFSECEGDCDDTNYLVFPGAPEVCDGTANNCDVPTWPEVSSAEHDGDGDSIPMCEGFCSLAVTSYASVDINEHAFLRGVSWAPATISTPFGTAVSWVGFFGSRYDFGIAILDEWGRRLAGPVLLGVHSVRVNSSPRSWLAWSGSEFGMLWPQDTGALFFSRLDDQLVRMGSDTTVTGDGFFRAADPTLSWTGTEFLAVWYGRLLAEAGEDNDLWAARIDAAGNRIGVPFKITHNETSDSSPAIASSGSSVGLTWVTLGDYGDVYFHLLNPFGVPVGAAVSIAVGTGDASWPTIAWHGAGFGIAWRDTRDGNPEIYFCRLDASGNKIGPDVRVTASPGEAQSPSLAWTGNSYRIAWEDWANGEGQILVAVVDASGQVTGLPEVVSVVTHQPAEPSIAWTGEQWMVAWADDSPVPGTVGTEVFVSRESCHDCDDTRATVAPGAAQVCDGLNNDCSSSNWPSIASTNDGDDDGDGFSECEGDCSDTDSARHPGVTEVCNSVDDDCDSATDEDALGVDTDGDAVRNACDNCRFAFNPTQLDSDGDVVGNSCDNCALVPNASQVDTDADQRGNACDNCVSAYNPFQDDFDADRVGDACDNCAFDWNDSQSDFDHDNQGDFCDLNDGLIYIYSTNPDYIEWQNESGASSWNVYEGSLSVLRSSGVYTQVQGSNPLAGKTCGVGEVYVEDFESMSPGAAKFALVTGVTGGLEGSLGTNSAGAMRSNTSPCP